MFLGEVDYVRWFVNTLTQIVDVKMLTFVNHEEFAHSAHKPAIVRIEAGITTFRIEVKQTPFELYYWVLACLVPDRSRG